MMTARREINILKRVGMNLSDMICDSSRSSRSFMGYRVGFLKALVALEAFVALGAMSTHLLCL